MATELIIVRILTWLGFIVLSSILIWTLSYYEDDKGYKLVHKLSGYTWFLGVFGICVCALILYLL